MTNRDTKEEIFFYQVGIFLRDLTDAFRFFGILLLVIGLPALVVCIILELL